MKLIKKLTQNEIRTGFISLSQNLLGDFYPMYTREDIENAPDRKIRIACQHNLQIYFQIQELLGLALKSQTLTIL